MQKINILHEYFRNILGIEIQIDPLRKKDLMDLPLYIRDTYLFYKARLFNNSVIFLEPKDQGSVKISVLSANVELVKKRMGQPVAVMLNICTALQRRRLIEKGINFVVPGIQLFLPEMLIDFRKTHQPQSRSFKGELLRPSAQFILFFHLLHSDSRENLAEFNFKSVAAMTGYSPMTITLAADNLKNLGLIRNTGTKDKAMIFRYDKKELWDMSFARSLIRTPVRLRVFVDEKPPETPLLKCNIPALSDYSELNPGIMEYYAIDHNEYKYLKDNDMLENPDMEEGRVCLEVWRYNPRRIWGDLSDDRSSVDPLSLYLSLQDMKDERVEMALEQMIQEFPW